MHWFTDEWRIDENNYCVSTALIFNYIKINKLPTTSIQISDIAYKKNIDKTFYRYHRASISFPVVVSEILNPEYKKYRLIDGRHRIHKLLDLGINVATCYIVPADFILSNLKKVDSKHIAVNINI
jgi:hypothetical protein